MVVESLRVLHSVRFLNYPILYKEVVLWLYLKQKKKKSLPLPI